MARPEDDNLRLNIALHQKQKRPGLLRAACQSQIY
jgi:hypothetical protein